MPTRKKKTVKKRAVKPKQQVVVPDGVDPLLTPMQVALALGFTNKRKALEMMHDRTLTPVNLKKKGQKKNQWRVRLSELNRYMNSL